MLKSFKKDRGFTLVEMAMSMIVLGLIMTPAVVMYQQHRTTKNFEKNEEMVDNIQSVIGGFRSINGRYPCPASLTAKPGDVDYGFPDCTVHAGGVCVDGTCTYDSTIAGKKVLKGALPFKTLNLDEDDAYDTYGNRLSYAVTLDQTTSATFSMNGGGIGVVGKNGDSVVSPSNTGHFIVVSHGPDGFGAYTRDGVLARPCTDAGAAEKNNCDSDAIFSSVERSDTSFDDRVSFSSGIEMSAWQNSETSTDNIHLKEDKSYVVIGAKNTTADGLDQAGLAALEIRKTLDSASGSVATRKNFNLSGLCTHDTKSGNSSNEKANCFPPSLFTGTLKNDNGVLVSPEAGKGISCGDKFMVGLKANGEPDCRDEIYISCPKNLYIAGFKAGKILCGTKPEEACVSETVKTTCGTNRTLPPKNSNDYTVTYSGRCLMAKSEYNASYFSSKSTLNLSEMQGLILNINKEDRSEVSCGSTASEAQVRDTFMCKKGVWNLEVAHERQNYGSVFPVDALLKTGTWPAENDYQGTDASNNNGNHDCWCREDYRVVQTNCPSSTTGIAYVVQKHSCPQTSHGWTTVYSNTKNCGCTPGTTLDSTQSCASYYNEINKPTILASTGSLINNVTKKYDVTCVGNVPTKSTTPTSVDTSQCACPANKGEAVNKTLCPVGNTNSWIFKTQQQTGVEKLSTQAWTCPSTKSKGLPDPGYYEPAVQYSPIPACTCNPVLAEKVTKSCPSGQEGKGLTYEKKWDCAKQQWEPEINWTLIEADCNVCAYKAPAGSPNKEQEPIGKKVGSPCACGGAPAKVCYDYAASGFDVYTGCACVAQK